MSQHCLHFFSLSQVLKSILFQPKQGELGVKEGDWSILSSCRSTGKRARLIVTIVTQAWKGSYGEEECTHEFSGTQKTGLKT